MIFKLTPISIAIFISTLVNVFVTYTSWRRRKSKGGFYFALASLAITFWTLFAALDYSVVEIQWKVFFAQLESLGYMTAVALYATFSLSYAGYDDWLKRPWVKILLVSIPAVNILLTWTNGLHHWIWAGFTVNETADNVVIFEHGPAFTWVAVSGYVLILIIFASLLNAALRGPELARKQARLLLAALLTLVASNLLYLFDFFNIPGVDWSSITFSVTGLLFVFALYGSRFMDVVPVARNTMVDRMGDGVLVLDSLGNLVDLNPAAQSILALKQDALWQQYDVALKPWPEIVQFLREKPSGQEAMEISIGDPAKIYDLRLSMLEDNRNRVYGLLVVMREITARKLAEAARQKLSRTYKAILETAGEGIYGADKDGKITFINPAAARMLGWPAEELIGMQNHYLFHHTRPDGSPYPEADCPILSSFKDGTIHQGEEYFWRLDGTGFPVEFTSNPVQEEHQIVGSVVTFRDITEKKQAEAIIRLRLRLWELSSRYTVEELMQKALDEICELTGSPIGFYHFVNEDQNSLALQAWSTRTLEEYCQAEGAGRHYPIADAGVWADCIHQKKPVIHNDYASLPHRKGLPKGHAALLRELVVPILRDNKVVSVLGVGNKASAYDDQDVRLVNYIADIIWTIIEHKRNGEQIQHLNDQLKRLAMTDELTSLANRRAFFLRGSEEIRRVQRHPSPFSLLMLDIDNFKNVNDTFGHAAGDAVLQRIAGVLMEHLRMIDISARLGGEEFGILLPNTRLAEAVVLAERIRKTIEKDLRIFQGQTMGVTVSIGAAEYSPEIPDLDVALRKADDALYRAKNQGRNKVIF